MKYLLSAMLSISTLFGFGACDTCKKLPISVPVDFSKKGTVYETDFQAPWNIWGSLIQFDIGVYTPDARSATDEVEKVIRYIWNGHPEDITPYFKVKITLIPLGWASDDIKVILNSSDWVNRKEKYYTKGQKIEEIVSLPLYGGGTLKVIMMADLQRLRNYHVKVEVLEDIELPKSVHTSFDINRASSKH